MTIVAQFADPQGTARSRLGPRKDVTPLDLPGAHESGDSMVTVAQVVAPQGAARSRLGPRKTSLRWTSQEPIKEATVSQLAAPREGEVSFGSAWARTPQDLPGGRESGDGRAVAPPSEAKVIIWVCADRT